MCTRNRVHKQKYVVYKLHVCTNDILKNVRFIYISLFYKNSNFHTLGII